MLNSQQRRLTRKRTLDLLTAIDSASPGISLYLPAGSSWPEITISLSHAVTDDQEILAQIESALYSAKSGGVLFWGNRYKYLLVPPFPISIEGRFEKINIEPVRSWLQQELMIGLVLVRLGEYAIGVFRGERLLDSKHGTGLVHSRHKKGGSSQRRFERHREKQIESFFTRVCAHARTRLEPHLQNLDYLFYGGERNTINSFRKQCSFLEKFDTRVMDKMLNVRKPGKASLENTIVEISSYLLIEWIEA